VNRWGQRFTTFCRSPQISADEYEYATRSEAAATIRGLIDRWLDENA